MDFNKLLGPLEALLFAAGEPISEERLQEILEIDLPMLTNLLNLYNSLLENEKRGLQLKKIAGGWQLSTKEDFYLYVSKLTEVSEKKKLSLSNLETLAIIAFKQPITKQEIEKIRGVHVERTIAKLIELELITEVGRKDVIGRPVLYGTTDIFLQCFGLNDLKDLPPFTDNVLNDKNSEQLVLIAETEKIERNEYDE